jgi:hypothetical protein
MGPAEAYAGPWAPCVFSSRVVRSPQVPRVTRRANRAFARYLVCTRAAEREHRRWWDN